MKIVPSVCFWLLAIMPTLVISEDKIPSDFKKFSDLFLTEEESSAYAKLEAWVFEDAIEDAEMIRRMGVAKEVLVSGAYVNDRYLEYERWIDPFIAKIDTEKGDNWRALREAALILESGYLENNGVLTEGKFVRGAETGGPVRYCDDRDKFRAIHFYQRAIALCKEAIEAGNAEASDLADLYFLLADCLDDRHDPSADFLTDLKIVPELATKERNRWNRSPDESLVDGRSPALGENGEFILPASAASFEVAPSDLARQRWLLEEAARISPAKRAAARIKLAQLWRTWLGVENLVEAGYFYVEGIDSELDPDAPGEFELHTLKSNQTILITPSGLRRMTIPPEFSYIEILESLIADPETPEQELGDAYTELIDILSNRRQFKRGEQLARAAMKRLPEKAYGHGAAEDFLLQIKPDGRFLPAETFVAGKEISVDFLSRNVDHLDLELWQLDVDKAVSAPGKFNDLFHYNSYRYGNRNLNEDDRDEFLPHFHKIRKWTAAIEKRANHLQSRSTISIAPLPAGHYYLISRGYGKAFGLIIQVESTMLIATPIELDDYNYLLLDSASGVPVIDAEIFPIHRSTEAPITPDHTGSFSMDTSEDMVLIRRPGHPPEFKTSGILEASLYDGDPEAGHEVETLLVTNQPLYRPGQTVNFSCWVRQPGNRWVDASKAYRDTKVNMQVEDPTGRIIFTETYDLDDYGAFSGSFPLDPDTALGTCMIRLESIGTLSNPDRGTSDPFAPATPTYLDSWRVEIGEFRKPDFRVEVEAQGIRDDGTIGATVRASYNSGEPMVGAEVIGELTAYPSNEVLFPKTEFEDLYEIGYDWPLPESAWLPDWQTRGIRHSMFGEFEDDLFYDTEATRLETTGRTDENGECKLVFPGKLPKFGDYAYQCRIRAAVLEFSGRSMLGETSFTESGHPQSLFLRPDKGFYQAGEKITLSLHAMDNKREPVSAKGKLRVDRITYEGDERTPAFEKILDRPVNVTPGDDAAVSFTPPAPGQYLCMFTSGKNRRGIVLNVLADDFEARDLRFNPIQLTPDRTVCAPGDTIEVAIHCDSPDALVWLFQVMQDGRRQTPRMMRLDGKVAVVSIFAPPNGAPNFQLLAMTVANGKLQQTRCQISLPPHDKVLAVELAYGSENPAPGDQLDLTLDVRDHLGTPTPVSFAITAFDRSLEDLADPLPETRRLFPSPFEPFWGEYPLKASNRNDDMSNEAFPDFWEPGCFSDRSGLVGKIVRGKESRISKVGEELFITYQSPELPNSVGSGGGIIDHGLGGAQITSFPVTPATPTSYSIYSRTLASRIDLETGAANALKTTAARSNLADYAYWGAAMTTDAQGRAALSFPLPDNLTAWKAQAWAFGKANQFGDAQLEIPVSKPLQIRPVLPRSAVHGDKLEIAATVQNLSDKAADFHLLLEVRDLPTNLPDGNGESQKVTVAAGGEGIVTWQVELHAAGTANFRFLARSTDGSLSDGTEIPLIVAPRTTPVIAVATESIDANETLQEMTLDLRDLPHDAPLSIRLSARPRIDALAAIPKLVSYPFGCAEQTLNRFLPLLVASKKIENLGGDWDAMMPRITVADDSLGWIRGRPLLHSDSPQAPVTREKADQIIRAGLKRLDEMANNDTDDAWAWFKGGTPSPYITALVIRASAVAKRLGYEHEDGGKPVERISTYWLSSYAKNRGKELEVPKAKIEPTDAFIVHVLSLTDETGHLPLQEALLKRSDELPLSGRIFLALSLDPKKQTKALAGLLPAIHKEMEVQENHTNSYRHWWQDSTETRAWYLMLLTHLDPEDPKIPEQVERLLAMRTNGLVWKSTRDTALCVEAIAGTLTTSDFGSKRVPGIPVEIEIAGKSHAATLESDNFWAQDVTVPITRDQLEDGMLRFTIRRKGESNSIIRAAATVAYDADAAEHVTASSNGLQVHRSYYLIRQGEDPLPLGEDTEITAGDLIEVELKLQSPQARDFVHLSDPIPAGLEPLYQLSGHEIGAYRESRLGETHLFIQHLDRWNDRFRYRLRAVTPGTSLALPARAECMYAPSIFGSAPPRAFKILTNMDR